MDFTPANIINNNKIHEFPRYSPDRDRRCASAVPYTDRYHQQHTTQPVNAPNTMLPFQHYAHEKPTPLLAQTLNSVAHTIRIYIEI